MPEIFNDLFYQVMQAFCFHPRYGAIKAYDSSDPNCSPYTPRTNLEYVCPNCNKAHGLTGVWLPLNEKKQKLCSDCANKQLDKTPSFQHNKPMCMTNVRFVTAVALAVQQLRTSPFSAYSVTSKLREQVNAGDLTFTDKTPEQINGNTTYRVDHQEVREVVRELIKNNVVQNLVVRDTGSYIEYSDAGVSTPTPTATQPTFHQPPPAFVNVTCAGQQVAPPTALPPDAALRQKVQDYLKGRSGQPVTMKEVQSRFKGVSKTCEDWGNLIANMGLPVNTQGTPSFWTVTI